MRVLKLLNLFACLPPFLAVSCHKNDAPPPPPPLAIGLNLELTGDIQTIGQSARNAAELFFSSLNESGGVRLADGSRVVRLITNDNTAEAAQAAATAQHLILRDKVIAMIGPNSESCAYAASNIAEALKCVMISPWSADKATTTDRSAGTSKRHVFRAGATDETQGHAMALFARHNLNARTAAILETPGPGPATQAAAFKKTFAAEGGEITAQDTIPDRPADAIGKIATLTAAAPDVVFLAAPCDDALPILQAAREAGLNAIFLGTGLWNSPLAFRLGETGLDRLYYSQNFDPRANRPAAQKFVADYTARYGQPPDEVAALTYDSCALIVEALQKSGKADREAVREALARTQSFAGVTGTFDFEPGSGDPAKSLDILQIIKHGTQWAGDTSSSESDKKIAP